MRPSSSTLLTAATLLEAEITSRVIDHTARWLRSTHGLGYYTIGSAGHESNAAVALALRPTDPALLHYRSGGFYIARAMQAAAHGLIGTDPVEDILRGMLARSTEPIAGGRHKVFGRHDLSIIPQTSTIASHLPRAVGLALSFSLAPSAATTWPADSIVVCSFGDGSLNHSTAQGAINWAAHASAQGRRVPILFVCEDNGIGLSVPSPDRWVDRSLAGRPGFEAAQVDGADPAAVLDATTTLVDAVRSSGRPGILQLRTVRFLGHAGTDVESAYRTPRALESDRARDPIIGSGGAGHRDGKLFFDRCHRVVPRPPSRGSRLGPRALCRARTHHRGRDHGAAAGGPPGAGAGGPPGATALTPATPSA